MITNSCGYRRYRPFLPAALVLMICWVPISAQAESTSATRLSVKDTVVLGDLDNDTGEAVFDDALKQALAMELGQSPFLNVLSDRKISETMRALGHPTDGRIPADVARELCLRTESKAVLGGAISKQSDQYQLQLTAIACDTGDTFAEERSQAVSKDDVLKTLSQASSKLRVDLGEPPQSVQQFDVPIEVATSSLEALKDYRIGIMVRREKGDTPSLAFLKQAVDLDPNFPMPYAVLTAIYGNLRQPTVALQYARKAYQLRDRVGERDALQISGIYFLATGDLDNEIQNYDSWQTKYPRDSTPYNNLGNDYAAMGKLDKALAEYQQALQLAPSVLTYTNVAGMDLELNLLDADQAVLDEAAAHKVDGRYLHQSRYWLAFVRKDTAQMQQQVDWALGKPGDEDALLTMQSDTEAYYGRLTNARALSQRAADSAVHSGGLETAALWEVNAALREAESGNPSSARQGVARALVLSTGREVKLVAAFTLARTGDNAGAKSLVSELEKDYPTDTMMKLYWFPTIDAVIELNKGHSSKALEDLETVRPYELGYAGTFISYLYPAYVRGQAYLLAHEAGASAAEFQDVLDHYGIVVNFMTGALAHLQLGRSYVMAGDMTKAKA